MKNLLLSCCALIFLNNPKQSDCLNDIDFSNEKFVKAWAQECRYKYGMASGTQIKFNSKYIECLFEIEKLYTSFDPCGCYFLYDSINEKILVDLRLGNDGFERNIENASTLNEILKLYKNSNHKNSNSSPLKNSGYKWIYY